MVAQFEAPRPAWWEENDPRRRAWTIPWRWVKFDLDRFAKSARVKRLRMYPGSHLLYLKALLVVRENGGWLPADRGELCEALEVTAEMWDLLCGEDMVRICFRESHGALVEPTTWDELERAEWKRGLQRAGGMKGGLARAAASRSTQGIPKVNLGSTQGIPKVNLGLSQAIPKVASDDVCFSDFHPTFSRTSEPYEVASSSSPDEMMTSGGSVPDAALPEIDPAAAEDLHGTAAAIVERWVSETGSHRDRVAAISRVVELLSCGARREDIARALEVKLAELRSGNGGRYPQARFVPSIAKFFAQGTWEPYAQAEIALGVGEDPVEATLRRLQAENEEEDRQRAANAPERRPQP